MLNYSKFKCTCGHTEVAREGQHFCSRCGREMMVSMSAHEAKVRVGWFLEGCIFSTAIVAAVIWKQNPVAAIAMLAGLITAGSILVPNAFELWNNWYMSGNVRRKKWSAK